MISKIKIGVGADGENVRKYNIHKKAYIKAMNTLLGMRVRGSYIKSDNNLGGHEGDALMTKNGLMRTPKPITYGFVEPYEEPLFETITDEDGTHDYVFCYAYVWTGIFPELDILNYKQIGQSIEIKIVDGEMIDGIYHVYDFIYTGLCMLGYGNGIKPTFENAQVEVVGESNFSATSKEDFMKKLEELMEPVNDLIASFSDGQLEVVQLENEYPDWVYNLVQQISDWYGIILTDDDMKEIYDAFKDDHASFAVPDKYSGISFKPPASVAKQAEAGLKMREEQPDSNKCCTPTGLARARQLVNRQVLSPSTVKRMKSFFDRHEVDKQSESWKSGDSKAEQSWKIWGGDPGYRWAKKVVAQMEKADEQAKMSTEEFAMEDVKVSTDGSKAIDGNVGKKDVGAMKKKILNAPNAKSIIKKVFARYPGDLSGDIVQADIGYPLMSERDGVFYYNKGFIKAASSRIEQQSDQPYYNQVKKNIEKARKAVGMPEDFSKEGVDFSMAMDKNMMKMFAMKMESYGMGGRYVPYAYDDKMMYAMDMEENKPMAVPYAMKDDMPEMGMDKMAYDMEEMAYDNKDYENMLRALNTVMMMLKEKYDKMKEYEESSVAYSTTIEAHEKTISEKDVEITESKQSFIELQEKFTSIEKDLQDTKSELEEVKDENLKFSQEKLKEECVELLEQNQKHISDEQYEKFSTSIEEMAFEQFSDFKKDVVNAVYERLHNTTSDTDANFSVEENDATVVDQGEEVVVNDTPVVVLSQEDNDKTYANDWEKLKDKYKDQ